MHMAKKRTVRERGSAVLIAVVAMALFAGIGITAVSILTGDHANRTASLANEQAESLAQAGVEYAKNRIDQGMNPVATVAMGEGTFTIAAGANSGQLVVTGTVGNAKKTYNLTTNFGAQCIDMDVSQAHTAADNIVGVKLTQHCLSKIQITDWQLSWTPDQQERSIKLQVQGSQLVTLYDTPAGYASGTKIDSIDYLVSGNGVTPVNKIQFAANIPGGKTYTITIFMADGSSLTKSFVDPGNSNTTNGYTNPHNGNIVVDPTKTVTVQALCSLITYGAGGPDIPVYAWLGKNGTYQSLYNGADINGGEVTNVQSGGQGTTYSIKANAKYVSGGHTYYNATYASTNTAQVKTLSNGDPVPALQGFGGQQSVSSCLQPYVNIQNGKVVLNANQSIMLFELGVNMTANPTSPAADFQDLVVLLTVN